MKIGVRGLGGIGIDEVDHRYCWFSETGFNIRGREEVQCWWEVGGGGGLGSKDDLFNQLCRRWRGQG